MKHRNTVLAALLSIVLVFALVLPAAAAWGPSPTISLLVNHALLPDSSLSEAMPQIALAEIAGQTRDVNCTIPPSVIVKAYLDGVEKASAVSDAGGNYTLVLFEPGEYEVVAGTWGFRDRSRSIHIELEQGYALEFSADHGFIPNAPGMSYVLACINLWQFGEPSCKLSMSTVLAVINAWQFPVADEIVYYEHTKEITEEEAENITGLSEDRDRILFQELTDFVAGIQVGDVLVSEHSIPGAEHGFLKRVTGVTNLAGTLDEGGVVEIAVEPATLEDVIERGVIEASGTISAETLLSTVAWAEGVEITQVEDEYHFSYEPMEGVTIEGYLRVTADADVHIRASIWSGLQEFVFTFSPGLGMEATMTVEQDVSWSGEVTIGTLTGPPIPIWGPVIITPEIELVVGTEGEITATLEATVTYERGYDVGIRYSGGKWSTFSEIWGDGATLDEPTFSGQAEARVFGGAILSGKAGVSYVAEATLRAKVLGNVRASGEIANSPWRWQYDLELYLTAQVFADLELCRIAKVGWESPTWEYPDPRYNLAYGASGRVTTEGGDGLEGVEINFSGGHSSATTDTDGYWTRHLLSGHVEITPERTGYVFDPPTRTITRSASDLDFEAFEGEPVEFPDANLEAAIREAIGKPDGPIYRSDLWGLTYLDARERNISELTGLEYCISLTVLYLYFNQISDISPLAGLTSLTVLYIWGNQISDISPLAGLTSLTGIILWRNQISDISSLAGLTSLIGLSIGDNQISDISPLANLTSLYWLDLSGNQIRDISPLAGLTSLTSLYLGSNQIRDISPLEGLTSLTDLWLGNNQIGDISPLEGLTSLTDLYLSNNQISDISPIAGLTSLTDLYLSNNQISDISPIAGLTSLTFLRLYGNQISDISPLANLTSLYWLDLSGNQIRDISPLVDNTGLGAGDTVDLRVNPLSGQSINEYILALQARGVTVYYDEEPGKVYLTVSSTAGGSVTTPGEDTFAYDYGTVVDLVSEAEEGYRFVNWTGDVTTIADINAAATNITMSGDYALIAVFEDNAYPGPTIEDLVVTAEHACLEQTATGYKVGRAHEYQIECILSDVGGELFWQWSCNGGILHGTGGSIIWIAPDEDMTVIVTVEVFDSASNMATESVELEVAACSEFG